MSKAREISELGDVVTVDGSNVGIGTSSPSAKLEVTGDVQTTWEAASTKFVGSKFSTTYDLGMYMDTDNRKLTLSAKAGDSTGTIAFQTGVTPSEVMRIDNTGRVGIGTSSPAYNLHIANTSGNAQMTLQASDTGFSVLNFGDASDDNIGRIQYKHSEDAMQFLNSGGAERMRIDASGSLLVGQTTANSNATGIGALPYGSLYSCRDGGAPFLANRKTSDGDIALFQKDGTTVGSIVAYSGSTSIVGNNYGIFFNSNIIAPVNSTGLVRVDNLMDIGQSAYRFNDIYATNGTIQTSDANEKQQIAELTAAEMQAAKAISKMFKTFKWNDSVAEKGDAARIHTGVIAQEVEAAMTAAGLDAGRYAFFISSTWWESTEVIPAVEAVAAVEATYDEEGNILTEAVEAVEAQPERTVTHIYGTAEEAPEGAVERTRKGIRYPQLLAFIGAATEQRLASIEARLDALETN